MDIAHRTALIVGGTSGIGRGLAERLVAAGSTVIVSGRRPDPTDGLTTVSLDVTDSVSVRRARNEILAAHPALDLVVTMAGVMLLEDLQDPAHIAIAEQTIQTNLLGTIRVLDAFTPHLVRRGGGDLVTVTSGIAYLPFPPMPSYGASKAGVHAYSESLRAQLAGTGVRVTELVPPAVATPAQGDINPSALPLETFLDEAVGLMSQASTPDEILVEGVHAHRWAERDGTYSRLVAERSQAIAPLLGRRPGPPAR